MGWRFDYHYVFAMNYYGEPQEVLKVLSTLPLDGTCKIDVECRSYKDARIATFAKVSFEERYQDEYKSEMLTAVEQLREKLDDSWTHEVFTRTTDCEGLIFGVDIWRNLESVRARSDSVIGQIRARAEAARQGDSTKNDGA